MAEFDLRKLLGGIHREWTELAEEVENRSIAPSILIVDVYGLGHLLFLDGLDVRLGVPSLLQQRPRAPRSCRNQRAIRDDADGEAGEERSCPSSPPQDLPIDDRPLAKSNGLPSPDGKEHDAFVNKITHRHSRHR
jgi:hypothetical protein